MSHYDTFNKLMQSINAPGFTPGTTYASGMWVQVVVCCENAAKTITDESTGTTDHPARIAWAQKAQSMPLSLFPLLTYGVVEDATIISNGTGASTDGQVQAALDALVPTLVDTMVF